jgi:putative superfamily III holin-X
MPRTAKHARLPPRPEISSLLQQLAGDGVRWANAELALARAELLVLRRRSIAAAIFAAVAIAALLAALIILSQAGVAAMARYLGSDIAAGLAVAASLLALAALCALAARRMFSWKGESAIFRWFAPSTDQRAQAAHTTKQRPPTTPTNRIGDPT